jgi:hypothetical protein
MVGPKNPEKPFYAFSESKEIKSLTELPKYLGDPNKALEFHFRHNSFDLIRARNGTYSLALRSPKKQGQILVIPQIILLEWYANLPQDERNKLPQAYREYFEAQLQSYTDTEFAELKKIQIAQHKAHPEQRQSVREKIPTPYTNVKHISDVYPKWMETESDFLMRKLRHNTFHFQECRIGGQKRRVVILGPNNPSDPALYLTNEDLTAWFKSLLPSQKDLSVAGYNDYFSKQGRADINLEEFTKIHNSRMKGLTTFNPIDLNPPSTGNRHSFHQAAANVQGVPNYQPAPIAHELVAKIVAHENWDIGAANSGDADQLYREIKSKVDPGLKVEQYERSVRVSGQLTEQKANMAASIAGSASPVICICNEANDIAALAIAFHTVLEQGKIPFAKPGGSTSTVTQEDVLSAVAVYFPEKYQDVIAVKNRLQTNLNNTPENEKEKAKSFYTTAFPSVLSSAPIRPSF